MSIRDIDRQLIDNFGVRTVTAAEYAINLFGSPYKMASAFEKNGYRINPSAIYRWTYPRDRKGSDGRIPSDWHKAIIECAEAEGIQVEYWDKP